MLVKKDADYERYRRFRAVGKELSLELVHRLQKKDIHRCAKDLGLLKKNTLILNSEDDLSILMDYCIHNPFGKKSCIDVYIEQSSLEQVSDEMMMLKALRESFFAICRVNRTEKGYLCYAEDILRRQDIVLMDVGFGFSAVPGVLIATRLMKMPARNHYVTTGAPVPIQERQAMDGVETILRKFIRPIESGTLSHTQANSLGKQVIRLLLRQDNENTRFADPEEHEQALRESHFRHN